jgi:malonate transporter
MSMASIILSALLPILFIAFLGWLAGRLALFGPKATTTLSTFVVRFALPLSLFLAAARTRPEQLLNARYVSSLAVGLIGTFLVGILLGRMVFGRDLRASALQGLSCSFPNLAYCGPPVLIAAVGAQGILAVIVGNLIVTVVIVPATMILLQLSTPAAGSPAESRWRVVGLALLGAVKQPLVWLPVLGAAIAIVGLPLPALLDDAVDGIGRSAGGVALFTLGLMLAERPLRIDRDIVANLAVKNLLQPALLVGAAIAFELEPTLTKEVFLAGVLPSATAAAVLAQKSGSYVEQAAGTTAASTFFSILTIAGGLTIAQSL